MNRFKQLVIVSIPLLLTPLLFWAMVTGLVLTGDKDPILFWLYALLALVFSLSAGLLTAQGKSLGRSVLAALSICSLCLILLFLLSIMMAFV